MSGRGQRFGRGENPGAQVELSSAYAGQAALGGKGASAASWPRAGGVSSLAKGGDYGQGARDAVYAFR